MVLKILTVLAGAGVGGAETFFVSLSAALKRAGLGVRSVIKPNAPRAAALQAQGIAVTTAPFANWLDFVTGKILRAAAAEFEPDCMLAFAGRAASFARKGNYALIGRLGGYYNLRNFQYCDYLVCNAPDLVRYVVDGGFQKDRVHLIPNFPSVPDLPAIARATFATPMDAPLAVALGRLHPAKALDVLLRAAAKIPSLWVWIAGEGPERGNLERLAQELKIANRTRFLGWRSDRAALYKAADVVVYPSREEPFGNVVVEAWSVGTPIVTTASTGPKWLARNGEDALVTPVDNPEALAEAIREVLQSKGLAKALIEGGRKRVAEEFSEAAIVKQYVDLFESAHR